MQFSSSNVVSESVLTPAEVTLATPQATWKPRLILTIKIIFAVGLLVWLVWMGKLDFSRLLLYPSITDLTSLTTLIVVSFWLPALRWWWLLRMQQIAAPLWLVTTLTWFGYFTSIFLPGSASGDVARGYLLLRDQKGSQARALSTMLADRFIGMFSISMLGSASLAYLALEGDLDRSALAIASTTVAILVGMTIVGMLLLVTPTRRLLLGVLPVKWQAAWDESFRLYQQNKLGLLGCLALSTVANAATFSSLMMAGEMLNEPITHSAAYIVGPLILLAGCVPLTPGGIGIAETVSQGTFAGLGFSSGAEIMALTRLATITISLPGVFGMLVLAKRPEAVQP